MISGGFLNKNVVAWLFMVSAIAIHVIDEAMNGFLPIYNQIITDLKEKVTFLPAPTFSFDIWIGGLIGAIILSYGLTYFIGRGGKIIRIISVVLGFLMVGNAFVHCIASIYFGSIFPGALSSPLLLATALFVIVQGFRGDWRYR